MMENFLHPRVTGTSDWATVLFVMALVLIAVTKTVFENRFAEFVKLGISNKYIKVYRDSSQLMSWFNVLLFVINLISLSFFIQLILSYFGHARKDDWILFIRIFTLVGVFILAKYLIEKIVAASFNIEEFTDQFNLHKVSYRTYIGLLILPIDIVLYYNANTSEVLIFFLIFALLATNVFTYLKSLKIYQNLLMSKMFYFILYLCALEIAPYYFMYYWFTKVS